LLEAVEALRRKEGFPLVIVVHRLRQVRPHGNRVLVMREGRIVDDTRETGRVPSEQ
jgi:energy-coupling factor transporter ATP-binding protein EcfA2